MTQSEPQQTSPEAGESQESLPQNESQPQETAPAADRPQRPKRVSPLRILRTFFRLALVAVVCLGLVHLWLQAQEVKQLRFQVEQLAANALRQHDVLVTAEPPEGHVTSVNFQSKEADADARRHVDSNMLRHLAAFYHLGSLNLADTDITDRQLRYLSSLTTLNSLILGGTRVTDAGLEHLTALKGIESLQLPFTRVSDEGLAEIALIRDVSILDMSNTRVTDEGLKHLLGLKELKWLLLANNEITDEGLKQLEQMKGLGRLTIPGTKVTPEGRQRLEKAIPGISIDYRPGTAARKLPTPATRPSK